MIDVIPDCCIDKPSGLGAHPYLSVHSRYLAGMFTLIDREYYYLIINDISNQSIIWDALSCLNIEHVTHGIESLLRRNL